VDARRPEVERELVVRDGGAGDGANGGNADPELLRAGTDAVPPAPFDAGGIARGAERGDRTAAVMGTRWRRGGMPLAGTGVAQELHEFGVALERFELGSAAASRVLGIDIEGAEPPQRFGRFLRTAAAWPPGVPPHPAGPGRRLPQIDECRRGSPRAGARARD
jgi:hypothetical protein